MLDKVGNDTVKVTVSRLHSSTGTGVINNINDHQSNHRASLHNNQGPAAVTALSEAAFK